MYSDYHYTDQVYREFGESCLSLCLRANWGGGDTTPSPFSDLNHHQKRSSKLQQM